MAMALPSEISTDVPVSKRTSLPRASSEISVPAAMPESPPAPTPSMLPVDAAPASPPICPPWEAAVPMRSRSLPFSESCFTVPGSFMEEFGEPGTWSMAAAMFSV